jgi:DNA polymerase-3 subunit epsilon
VVDYKPTNSELGALVLENRLIKQWQPPGNRALKSTDGWVYVRCRLDIPYPVLEVAGEPAAGHAVNVGPLKGRAAAEELADQLNSLFQLRRCGRRLKLRPHPSVYGQMDRCLSPCLGDLDPNAYRRRLDEALGLFSADGDAGESLLATIEEQMRAASEARRYERAAALHRRLERMSVVLGRLGGVLRATHACSRLVAAPHPVKERFDLFWVVGGRVADWGPLPDDPHDVETRTEAALERVRAGRRPRPVPAEEADEVRIVGGWLAAHEPPQLRLETDLEPGDVVSWVERSTTGRAAVPA